MRVVLIALMFVAVEASANSGGITGRSGKTTSRCSSCHVQAGASASVTITGPASVTAGTNAIFTLTLTGGPGAAGGMNIATDVGSLSATEGSVKLSGTELTHAQPKLFAANAVSWNFRFLAPLTPGTATLYAAAQSVDLGGSVANDREALTTQTITINPPNQPPTVAVAPASAPATVTGNTAALSVLGADDEGEAALLYTWVATGPAAVALSANGTNAAKNVTATFTKAGSYAFTVTVKDAKNATAVGTLPVPVSAVYSTVKMAPALATLPVGGQLQLGATALDQFGAALASPSTFAWTASGGTLSSTGLFTAPAAPGTIAVTAAAGGKTGTSTLTVATGTPPKVVVAAAGQVTSPSGVVLSVLASDDGGEALLKYTWAATGPGAATFSANGTNGSKQTEATVNAVGPWVFTVTIRDAAGLPITSSVTVNVAALFTSATVSPVAATVKPSETVQFTTAALDQFGRPMTAAGTPTWLATGGGYVDGTGLFHAGTTLGGPFVLRAVLNGKTAQASVSVANGGVPLFIDAPSASPALVTGKTSRLRARADDDGGESALVYHWRSVGPSPVKFAPNDSNDAKTAIATFVEAGSYTMQLTAEDATGKTVSGSVTVEVEATPDSLSIAPAFVALKSGGTASFSTALLDQFGTALTDPGTVVWNAGPAGTINAGGAFVARSSGGTFNITATARGLKGSATVLIDDAPPEVSLADLKSNVEVKDVVTLQATVKDAFLVTAVRFYVDGRLVSQDEEAPFSMSWITTDFEDGPHRLTLEADDSSGNVGHSQPLDVVVRNRPVASAPAAGCSAAGGSLLPALLALAALARRRTRGAAVS